MPDYEVGEQTGASSNNNNQEEQRPTVRNIETRDIGGSNDVWVAEKVAPTVIARIFKQSVERMGKGEGSVRSDDMPTVKWEVMGGGNIKMDLHFHEKQIESEFSFESEYLEGSPRPPSVTGPDELGGTVGEVADLFEDAFNVEWEFTELSGASIGWGGSVVDFEFKYDGFTEVSRVENVNI